jgi:hypothetical protein
LDHGVPALPLTFTDENPPQVRDPVAAAQRSAEATAKASRQHDDAGHQIRSYQGPLDHLATMPRVVVCQA